MAIFFLCKTDETLHLFHRTVGIEDGAAYGNTADSSCHDVRDVGGQDAANGYDRDGDVVELHLTDNTAVTVCTEDGGQFLFGGGEAERTAADVVGSIAVESFDIVEGVGGAADDISAAQEFACLIHGHIVLAEMYAVGTCLLYPFCMVVEDECGMICLAELADGCGCRQERIFRRVFHAELDPATSACQGEACSFYVVVTVVGVCNKLYHCMISFSGLNKWFTGPLPLPMLTSLPASMAEDR